MRMDFNSQDSLVVRAIREVQHPLTVLVCHTPQPQILKGWKEKKMKCFQEREELFLVEYGCVEDTFLVFLLTYCVH